MVRSSGVKNQALEGLSGNRSLTGISAMKFNIQCVIYQNAIAVMRVILPVITISLFQP